MYNELYETWKRELEEIKLEKLSTDFYSRLADYMRTLRKESRMLDKRTVKARLLKNETRNVKRMVHELIQTRYRKIVMKAAEGERVPLNFLTTEEKKVYTGVLPFAEAYHDFAESLLSGRMLKLNVKRTLRRAVLRFLEEVPAIIGADMEAYGPFKVEDVASLPLENSRILVKQGLAELVNV
ncbi:DNA replication complex GINS family protein [Candidatus Bathyarchaeota archaeon]|nr:MAG: DNA replication complex GINS family protein [Candidatus Bathyarchaeota archaeon]